MTHRHLSDDRLVEIGLTEAWSAGEQQHLGACAACEAKRAAFAHMLDEIAQSAAEDADAAFPAERLARQERSILERLNHDARPGRVIAFPTVQIADSPTSHKQPVRRWIAAAAVAGLVVGLVAGRLGRELPGGTDAPQAASRSTAPAPGFRAATLSDDEFLGQIERAVDSRGGASLRALDDLTPRAWDVR